MCRVDTRVLMFGGENDTNLANDLWTLRGLGLDGEESPSWLPLELPGTAPAPRKGHACASESLEHPAINYSTTAHHHQAYTGARKSLGSLQITLTTPLEPILA